MSDPPVTADLFPLYRYRATATAVDGDTLRCRVQLGFGVEATVDVRLAGVNAPELVGPTKDAGEAARDWLARLVEGEALYLRTHKDRRSFARYLGEVYLASPGGALSNVSRLLMDAGHGSPA